MRSAVILCSPLVACRAEDLAELAARYCPGQQLMIPIRETKDGPVTERIVTITWAEVTSWRGTEVVDPLTSTESTKPQVAPDPGFPGPGQPGPGNPGTYIEEEEEEHQPQHQQEHQEGLALPPVEQTPPPPTSPAPALPQQREAAAPRREVEEEISTPKTEHQPEHGAAVAFVQSLPTGTRAPSQEQRTALVREIGRLLEGGADPQLLRQKLCADMADVKHFYGVFKARAESYKPEQFQPAPHRAVNRPEIATDTTTAPTNPQTQTPAREAVEKAIRTVGSRDAITVAMRAHLSAEAERLTATGESRPLWLLPSLNSLKPS